MWRRCCCATIRTRGAGEPSASMPPAAWSASSTRSRRIRPRPRDGTDVHRHSRGRSRRSSTGCARWFRDVIRDAYIPALLAGETIAAASHVGYFAEHSTPERYLAGQPRAAARPGAAPRSAWSAGRRRRGGGRRRPGAGARSLPHRGGGGHRGGRHRRPRRGRVRGRARRRRRTHRARGCVAGRGRHHRHPGRRRHADRHRRGRVLDRRRVWEPAQGSHRRVWEPFQGSHRRVWETLSGFPSNQPFSTRTATTVMLSRPPFWLAVVISFSQMASRSPSLVGDRLDLLVLHHAGQPVRAEHVDVAERRLVDMHVDLHGVLHPERAHDDVLVREGRDLVGREVLHLDVVVEQRVILGQLLR